VGSVVSGCDVVGAWYWHVVIIMSAFATGRRKLAVMSGATAALVIGDEHELGWVAWWVVEEFELTEPAAARRVASQFCIRHKAS
jgi:hypothetical protein